MAENRNVFQNIFGRLFRNEQEEQVRTWVQQVVNGGEAANSARESLLSLEPDTVMPLLDKIIKEHGRDTLGKAASTLYQTLLDSITAQAMAAPMEDLTIGSERLTPREFLERYGKEAFEKRYGVAPASTGGQSLISRGDRG